MAQFALKYLITAIGASSVTLTPVVGQNSSGPVTGTLPTGYQDLVGGHSTVVLNFSGTPDNRVFKQVGEEVYLEVGSSGA